MQENRKYNFDALKEIKQMDLPLAFKKLNSDMDALNKTLASYVAASAELDVDPETILQNHKTYIPALTNAIDLMQKLFLTAIQWDAENLLEAVKNGIGDVIEERYETLKISNSQFIHRLHFAECDIEGRLINSVKAEDVNPFLHDSELRNQMECHDEPIFVPIKQLEKMQTYISDLKLDKAGELTEKLIEFKYDDDLTEALEALKEALEDFDIDQSEELIGEIIQKAEDINKVRQEPKAARKRILAVDDVPDILVSIKGMLENVYDVCCVTNDVSAMRFLEVNSPDLILLDIELENANGFDILEKIRKMDQYKELPVMFLTSHTTLEYVTRAKTMGVKDFLRKPIEAAELIARCSSNLDV